MPYTARLKSPHLSIRAHFRVIHPVHLPYYLVPNSQPAPSVHTNPAPPSHVEIEQNDHRTAVAKDAPDAFSNDALSRRRSGAGERPSRSRGRGRKRRGRERAVAACGTYEKDIASLVHVQQSTVTDVQEVGGVR